jgi:hypothetical protein
MDRWCSTTSSAAVAIWRHIPGQWLHRVDLARRHTDSLDLRWLMEDAPHLRAQCAECRKEAGDDPNALPVDASGYLVHWGISLQEVLLDRCSRNHEVSSVILHQTSIPDWASSLAAKVVIDC